MGVLIWDGGAGKNVPRLEATLFFLSCRPLAGQLFHFLIFLSNVEAYRVKHHRKVRLGKKKSILALVGVSLEQGRGYLGSHSGVRKCACVYVCVSVFKSVQGATDARGNAQVDSGPGECECPSHSQREKLLVVFQVRNAV